MNKSTMTSKRIFIAAIAFICIAGAAAYALRAHDNNTPQQNVGKLDKKGVDPTSVAEQRKKTADSKSDTPSNPTTGTSTAKSPHDIILNSVFRSDDGSVALHASVDSVTDGTCLYDVTNTNGAKLHTEAPITLRVNTYACGPAALSATEMPKGDWTVTATYKDAQGLLSEPAQRTLTI